MSEQSAEDLAAYQEHLQVGEQASLDLEAYRQRRQAFEEAQHAGTRGLEINVNDLVGANGQRLHPLGFEVFDNELLTGEPDLFSERSQMPMDPISEKVLNRLAARKAPQISDGLKRAVYGMMEPMRTVFAGVFAEELPLAHIAAVLDTSVETVEFLLETSLEILSQVVEVRIREP